MKKSLFARGFIGAVASLLGVVAVGCSAETGGPEAEIGSTEQAIISSDVTAGPDLTVSGNAKALIDHAACKVTVSSTEFLMVAGGVDSNGNRTRSVFVLKPGTGWFEFTNVLPTALSKIQLITNPQDATSCLAIGGNSTGTTAVNTVTKLTLALTSGTPSSVANAASGTITARFGHQVIPCGTNKVLIAGGQSSGTRLASLEVWDNGTVTALKDSNNDTITLQETRSEFAMAQEDTGKIVMFGGTNGTTKRDSIEVLQVNTSCAIASDDADNKTDKISAVLTAARSGLVAWRSASNTFHVAGGNDGAASDDDDVVAVTFAASSSATITPGTMAVAAESPALAFDPSSGHAFLAGGVGVAAIQEFDGSWTSVTTDSASNALPTRQGGIATKIGSSVFVVGGGNAVAGNTAFTINPL